MRRLVAVVLFVGAVAWFAPVGAEEPVEVEVTEVGWWSARPGALAQGEGGFEVAASPTGEPQSIAALRLMITGSQISSLQVRLDEASSVGTQFGALKLCTTTASWSAANPGPMTDAPAADCTVSAGLTRTTDGVWLGDAAALAPDGGVVSLVIVPNYQPPAPIGPGMVVAIGGGDFAASGSTSTPTTDPGQTVDPNPFEFPAGGEFPVGGGSSFGIPVDEVQPDFGTVTSEPPITTDTTVPIEDDFVLPPVRQEKEPPPPWWRLVVMVPLSAGFGVGSVFLRKAWAEGLLGAG